MHSSTTGLELRRRVAVLPELAERLAADEGGPAGERCIGRHRREPLPEPPRLRQRLLVPVPVEERLGAPERVLVPRGPSVGRAAAPRGASGTPWPRRRARGRPSSRGRPAGPPAPPPGCSARIFPARSSARGAGSPRERSPGAGRESSGRSASTASGPFPSAAEQPGHGDPGLRPEHRLPRHPPPGLHRAVPGPPAPRPRRRTGPPPGRRWTGSRAASPARSRVGRLGVARGEGAPGPQEPGLGRGAPRRRGVDVRLAHHGGGRGDEEEGDRRPARSIRTESGGRRARRSSARPGRRSGLGFAPVDIRDQAALLAAIVTLALAGAALLRPARPRSFTLFALLSLDLFVFSAAEFLHGLPGAAGLATTSGSGSPSDRGRSCRPRRWPSSSSSSGVKRRPARRARDLMLAGSAFGLVVAVSPLARSDLASLLVAGLRAARARRRALGGVAGDRCRAHPRRPLPPHLRARRRRRRGRPWPSSTSSPASGSPTRSRGSGSWRSRCTCSCSCRRSCAAACSTSTSSSARSRWSRCSASCWRASTAGSSPGSACAPASSSSTPWWPPSSSSPSSTPSAPGSRSGWS